MRGSFVGAGLVMASLLACTGAPAGASPPSSVVAPPTTVAPPAPPPLPPTPPSAPAPVALPAPPPAPPPGARVLHPLSPDLPSCIEMYSVCVPDRGCTSAPFYLSCGQSGHVPDSRETLFCDCGAP